MNAFQHAYIHSKYIHNIAKVGVSKSSTLMHTIGGANSQQVGVSIIEYISGIVSVLVMVRDFDFQYEYLYMEEI